MILTSFTNDVKMPKFINTYTCYMENEPGCQSFFLPHINQQISGHKILVFENEIADLVNKMYAFKFEILSILHRVPIAVSGTGNKFHVFQSDLAIKRTW